MRTEPRTEPVAVQLPDMGITAFRSCHAARFSMPMMQHTYHKIVLVQEGCGYLEDARDSIALSPGTLLRIPPRHLHRFVDDSDCPMTLVILCLSSVACRRLDQHGLWQTLQEIWPVLKALPDTGAYHNAGYVEWFDMLIHEIGNERACFRDVVEAVARMLLVGMLRGIRDRQDSGRDDAGHIMAAMAYLQDHFTQPICIEELADLSRMSYRAFTSHFRRYTGSTVVEYLHQKRIAFAKQRLLATGDILASAYDAGFADLAHFYRIFKRMTGQTPRQYMLTQRQHQ